MNLDSFPWAFALVLVALFASSIYEHRTQSKMGFFLTMMFLTLSISFAFAVISVWVLKMIWTVMPA